MTGELNVCTYVQYRYVRSYCRHTDPGFLHLPGGVEGSRSQGGKKEAWPALPTELKRRMGQGERNDEVLRAGLATPQTPPLLHKTERSSTIVGGPSSLPLFEPLPPPATSCKLQAASFELRASSCQSPLFFNFSRLGTKPAVVDLYIYISPDIRTYIQAVSRLPREVGARRCDLGDIDIYVC